MDSLTQIVLGAAVGEATLGRKVGNRAMLWGGIAGTLPDLDVLANLVTDPMSALVYHRAFTHSFLFALLVAPILGLTVHRLYGGQTLSGRVSNNAVRGVAAVLFFLLLATGSYLMPVEVFEVPAITATITTVFFGIVGVVTLYNHFRRSPSRNENASFAGWTLLFFLAVVTHPLLDCFTAYGTQFWQPVAADRIAWNTISVADPAYTLPFLILLIAAARRGRTENRRRWMNYAGLAVSSAYLLFTVWNHANVRSIMAETVAERQLAVADFKVGPTILNNVLWSATGRTADNDFYVGQYSMLDKDRSFGPFVNVPGNHETVAPYFRDRDLRILRWFTQDYYAVIPRDSGYLQVSDLRYGLIGDDPADPASYIFSWKLDTSQRPVRVVREFAGPQRDGGEMLGEMWERLRGR